MTVALPDTAPAPAGTRPLTLAHVDAERGFSGGEEQVFLLMEGLRDRGHRNVLVAPGGSRAAEEAQARGFEFRPAAMRSDLDVLAVGRLVRVFGDLGCDLVHLHTGRATWLGGLAAAFAGLPAITTRRMDRRVKRSLRTRLIYSRLVRRAVAISPAVARCLAEGGVAERTRTIASSVDPERLAPERPREVVRRELEVPGDELVFLTLATLVRRKGLDVLLRAFERLPVGPRLWIAGAGPERAPLEAQARELGLGERVAFLGQRADRAALLGAADVFVLASRREGLGVAALEAMAVGLPVVGTRVGGLAEAVVDGECGRLVEPNDEEALAAALAELADDPDLRRRFGAAGPRRIASGYHARDMVLAYEALYREVLEEVARA